MKLAFSTNAFTRFSLADAINAIADAGYDGVEILADVPHAYVGDFDRDQIRQTRDLLRERNLAVSNINANCTFGYWSDAPPEPYFEPSLISPNPEHRRDRQRMILQTLDLAAELDAQNISITSGRCLGSVSPKAAVDLLDHGLAPVLDRAETLGINVGIELEPGLFLEHVTELVDWIHRLGHPRFGANLDIGHSVVNGESITNVVKMLAGRTWNLHVEDLPGRKHYHMIPGSGTLDWAELATALHETAYDRFCTVELYTHTADPHKAAVESFTFLNRLFA